MNNNLFLYENQYWISDGEIIIIGIDEAGRGALAGPIVTAGVVFNRFYYNPLINDSKLLSVKQREQLFLEIIDNACYYFIDISSVIDVEIYNPKKCTILMMENIVNSIKSINSNYIALIDGEKISNKFNFKTIIQGDRKSFTIAAASILAKVTRDQIMQSYHQQYPYYDFINNKGYGTKKHLESLAKYGICNLHRKTYEPIKSLILKDN